MKIYSNAETANEIKKIIVAQTEQPKNVRIFISGMGWAGPSFGLALDELKEDDMHHVYEDISFVMENMIFEQFGDFKVEFLGGGYLVAPNEQEPTDCSSCSSSCS